MVTENVLIRNHIALIFSDLHYEKEVPYIINKINEKILMLCYLNKYKAIHYLVFILFRNKRKRIQL